MPLTTLITIICITFAIPPGMAQAEGLQRVDRAMAMVGSAVVTESDLRLHLAIGSKDSSTVPALKRNPDSVLSDAIDAALIRLLAGRVAIYQPNPAQLRTRLSVYREHWTDLEAWELHLKRLGLDEARLSHTIQRRMIIERVVSRALGAPKPGEEALWHQRYDVWVARERESVRVRIVTPTPTPTATPAATQP